jgi:protein-tyrosine phosphatase
MAGPALGYDRWIPVEGTKNFRDIGDYDASTGSVVARAVVYRSDALMSVTTGGVSLIRSLGIKIIGDFRTPSQVKSLPDAPALDAFARHLYAPISFPNTTDSLRVYPLLLLQNGPRWRAVMLALADPTSLPLVYHCQAGRDRAGVFTALLLSMLGVDRQTIIDDYMLSNGPYPTIIPAYIEGALDEIDAAGGPDAYLESIGVTDDARAAIRANLLVPRPSVVRYWYSY